MKVKSWLLPFLLSLACATTVTFTVRGLQFKRARAASREVMRVALEDAARRVRESRENLRTVSALIDAAALAKTRAFEKITELDPSILSSPERLLDVRKALEVGDLSERAAEAMRLTDVGRIADSMRLGRFGRVSIYPNKGLSLPHYGFYSERAMDNVNYAVVESDCGEYRIAVRMPEVESVLTEQNVTEVLILADVLLFVLVLLTLPASRRGMKRDFDSIRELFGSGLKTVSLVRRACLSPVVLVLLLFVVLAVALTGFVSLRTARRDAAALMRRAAADIRRCVDNGVNRIGSRGYYLVAKSDTGIIESCSRTDAAGRASLKSGDTLAGIGFDASCAPLSGDKLFKAELYGEKCLCLSEIRDARRIVSALPLAEIYVPVVRNVALVAGSLGIVLVLVMFFTARLSTLVESLKGYIASDARRQREELSLARAIQASSLPSSFPDEPTHRIFAWMDPAREVGGDFFDFCTLPSGRLLFLIGDISGKGVPAAMFMMKARSIIRAAASQTDDLERIAAETNDRLAEADETSMFMTCWMGAIDLATGEVESVNAGHRHALVKRTDGRVEKLAAPRALAFAVRPGVKYSCQRITLVRGEGILLYTDGVTETTNAAGEFYGEERLMAAMTRSPSERFVAEICADIEKFTSGIPRADDLAMLALDFKKPQGK